MTECTHYIACLVAHPDNRQCLTKSHPNDDCYKSIGDYIVDTSGDIINMAKGRSEVELETKEDEREQISRMIEKDNYGGMEQVIVNKLNEIIDHINNQSNK